MSAQELQQAAQTPASLGFLGFIPLIVFLLLIAYYFYRTSRKGRAGDPYRNKRFRDLSWASFGSFLVVWVLSYGLAFVLPNIVLVGFQCSGYHQLTGLLLLIFCICFVISTAALSRYIIRVLPLNADQTKRKGAFWFLVVLTFIGLLPWMAIGVGDSIWNGWLLISSSSVVALLWHSRPSSTLARPYALYLRRFSSFSDYAVTAEVLRGVPDGMRAVFLIGSSKDRQSWDPLIISFAGLKLIRPFASSPIYLSSSDSEWRKNVEELVRKAQRVVIDVSETSDAINDEVKIICELKKTHEIVWLIDSSARNSGNVAPRAEHCIEYSKSWVRGLPKMLFGYFLLVVALAYFTGEQELDKLVGMMILLATDFRENAVDVAVVFLGQYGLFALVAWVPLFCKPALSYRSSKEIRRMMR
ncbi:MAG: hypothetical protein EKK55_12065 [Rhodocyclaceae bacterium]|nr:MAG: hypothetical protein EKK55_12065 [Rhodocyclaceae bacterium]